MMRVNVLSLIGAFVGVLCIALPWMVVSTTVFNQTTAASTSLLDHLVDGGDTALIVAGMMFLAGSAFAFISPVGGIVQLLGCSMYLVNVYDQLGTQTVAFVSVSTSLGIGFIVALLVSVLVIVSFMYPVGVGYRERPLPASARLLVWSQLKDRPYR